MKGISNISNVVCADPQHAENAQDLYGPEPECGQGAPACVGSHW